MCERETERYRERGRGRVKIFSHSGLRAENSLNKWVCGPKP